MPGRRPRRWCAAGKCCCTAALSLRWRRCWALLPPTDVVLAEGFKASDYPKIAIYRAAAGKPLAAEPGECLAVVTDTALDVPCPQFSLDEPTALAAFLAARHSGG